MLNGNALAQIEPPHTGIHLFWIGPFSWVYSPGGWNIQRRVFSRRASHCEGIGEQEIARIRIEREWQLPIGWLSYRTGQFDDITPAEIFRLDLSKPTSFVRLIIKAKFGFSFALYRGKVVAEIKPKQDGVFETHLMATAIDAVVSYLLAPESIRYCIQPETGEGEEQSWENIPYIVKNLQLPIRELDPSLQNADQEFEKAKTRLVAGEDIDQEEFNQLLAMIRPTVMTNGYPRHIDKTILVRSEGSANFEELNATAPLASLISHPKWRRVMGFGWFDQDSALVPGQQYEYRITGVFPIEDLHDKVYGFHTISSGTALPASFFLDDLMLRFSQPPQVALAPGTSASGLQQLSRRGIALQLPNQFFWMFPVIHDWSVVINFLFPVQQIQLELMSGHSLQYEAWDYNNVVANRQPLPSGEVVQINFTAPVVQLRLIGVGFLFTIRISQSLRGLQNVSMILPPVTFNNHPRPAAPSFFEAKNLQELAAMQLQSEAISTSSQREALGFQLKWQAPLQNGLTYWPSTESTPPPIESTLYQIEHKQLPAADWKPLMSEENWIIGHRRSTVDKVTINSGSDMMQLFPEQPGLEGNISQYMTLKDVFDFSIDGAPVQRPLPPLGTTHQYRIRAIDIIGRPSDDWMDSNTVDLRKLLPPPVPVGPFPATNETDLTKPNGVHARVLVKHAPDLTAEEVALLGSDNNVIILKWGWHKSQRDQDPLAKEFRIYKRDNALDSIPGQLIAVNDLGNGRFECSLQLESAVKADVVKGTFIELGSYPFYVASHEAGTAIKMVLERRLPDANGQLSPPPTVNITLPMLIGSDRLQPQNWANRVAVIPITSALAYAFEFRNVLNLSASHPKDEVWLGVSTSDDEPYVEDKLSPSDNRKGNESPVVPVLVQGRFQGRPEFQIPPPLKDVPRLITKEPETGALYFKINTVDFFPPGILTGITHIRLERTDAGSIFYQYKVTNDDRVIAVGLSPTQPDVEVSVPNPSDKNNIIAALRNVSAKALADRYLVFLAGAHPYRASFFQPVTPNPVAVGEITDSLLPQTNRYVYRIRMGNAAGLISGGDAVLEVVVRVPSLKPGPIPEFIPRKKNTPPGVIQVNVPANEDATHAVLFYAESLDENSVGPPLQGALLRIANRRDLYPDKLLRMRTPAGSFAKQLIKGLNESDVVEGDNGIRIVTFHIDEEPSSTWKLWACTLTIDGIPSELAGPQRILITADQV